MLKKRSIVISGHRTSVSLEEPFWEVLKEIAEKEGTSLATLIDSVDHDRLTRTPTPNLSSALRLRVMAYLRP